MHRKELRYEVILRIFIPCESAKNVDFENKKQTYKIVIVESEMYVLFIFILFPYLTLCIAESGLYR